MFPYLPSQLNCSRRVFNWQKFGYNHLSASTNQIKSGLYIIWLCKKLLNVYFLHKGTFIKDVTQLVERGVDTFEIGRMNKGVCKTAIVAWQQRRLDLVNSGPNLSGVIYRQSPVKLPDIKNNIRLDIRLGTRLGTRLGVE